MSPQEPEGKSDSSPSGSLSNILSGDFARNAQCSTSNDSNNPTTGDSSSTVKTDTEINDQAIIQDIQDNIEATPMGDESPLNDDTFSKSGVRSKLGVRDIRLILYLIVAIKPFKYIGDRTLSQTKKWEMIQKKFAEYKQQERVERKSDITTIPAPTVRTLQRQLTSAIKKGKLRAREVTVKISDDLPISDPPIFKTVTRDSALGDMEMAAYELFELSESLKSGKIGNASAFDLSVTLESPPPSSAPSDPQEHLPSKRPNPTPIASTNSNPQNPASAPDAEAVSNLKSVNFTRQALRKLIAADGNPETSNNNEKIMAELLEQLVAQTNELVTNNSAHLTRLLEENRREIDEIKKAQQEHLDANKALMLDVISYFKNTNNVPQDALDRLNQLQ